MAHNDTSHDDRRHGSFFGRRKGHKLRNHQTELVETLLPRLALQITEPCGVNLNSLFEKIFEIINVELTETEIKIPTSIPDAYKLINKLHDQVDIISTKNLSNSIKLKVRAYKADIDKIEKT